MGKAARNRALRRQALAAKQSHPSDPRDQKGIARALKKGRIAGGPQTEYGRMRSGAPKMTIPKGK